MNQLNHLTNDQNLKLPFVSVCTPTFNRRPFIPIIIKCFLHQLYPQNRMEWIIIDDGNDKIEDLISSIENVVYIKLNNKITLGKKRNLMHSYAKGDIIVYMDDDDYYPPTRVSHAVEKLLENPNKMIAGCSELYVYFKHINQMWQFGPYGLNHATAGTFAFKKELLKTTTYNNNKSLAEEKEFLKNYSIPMVQLDPKHVILVFSHIHNTFDKKKLLKPTNRFAQVSDKNVDYFIKEPFLKNWFLNEVENQLNKYDLGLPKFKPDVMTQLSIMNKKKSSFLDNNLNKSFISMYSGNNTPKHLDRNQTVNLLQFQQKKINDLMEQVKTLQKICDDLQTENKKLIQSNLPQQMNKAANLLI